MSNAKIKPINLNPLKKALESYKSIKSLCLLEVGGLKK